jgi:hypothetical protein
LATMSNKKIVPISIAGVELITPPTKNWKINKGIIYVHINPPVSNIPQDRTMLNQLIQDIQNLIANQRKENITSLSEPRFS